MILLDTNVLLRDGSPTDPAHAVAKSAIAYYQAARESLCIVPQTIYEYWAVATRPVANNGLGLTVPECEAQVLRLKKLFMFLPDKSNLFVEWEALVVTHDCKGKVAHDARLIAAMNSHSVKRLLTFNTRDFARFPGITLLDPGKVIQAPNS